MFLSILMSSVCVICVHFLSTCRPLGNRGVRLILLMSRGGWTLH